jgi:hypothetical protein
VTASDGEVQTPGRIVRVRFEIDGESALAGGPVPVTGLVSLRSGEPVGLVLGASRATGRSDEYTFAADGPDGVPLPDPYADAIDVGGIEGALPLTADAPRTERVLLNQFLALEHLRDLLADGEAAELAVHCARRIRLDDAPAADPPTATAVLRVTLRRDDAALRSWADETAAVVLDGREVDVVREQRVLELVMARSAPVADALDALTRHPDHGIAARARYALDALGAR